MKLFKSIAFIFLLRTFSINAQVDEKNFEKDFDRAEKIFSEIYNNGKSETPNRTKGGYAEARIIFLNLYKNDTTNMNIAFKLGVCYQSSRQYVVQAIPYFIKTVTSVSNTYNGSSYKEKNAPLIAYKYLGDAYHLDYQFDKAIEAYEKYKSVMAENSNTDKTLLEETNHKIEICKTGNILTSNPVNVTIENLKSIINSNYPDYSPVISADQNTLFFTSRRPETTGNEKDSEGNYMEDIFVSHKTKTGWAAAANIGAPINTNKHEATVGISPDGQTILIYKDDMGDGNIYSTSLNGDIWNEPKKLNENINSKYWEPSASISSDGNTLYFTSDRPGGYGGRDLYTSKKLPLGDWGKAVNMGPNINTIYDEDAPFIHHDGKTLSFSSNGHNTMGGFDIFTSALPDNGSWSEPINVGFPINTTDDDIFYVVSPDGLKAYFSSFRKGGMGEKDNYVIRFVDRKETPLTLMKGSVITEFGKPALNIEIVVTDNATEEIVGIYHPNSKTGQFIFILTPGKNYNITYQADNYLFYSENMEISMETNYYEIYKAISLEPIKVGSKIILNNIFFDFDKSTLRALSNVELKNLTKILISYPSMKVEISGHTDSKGDGNYNQKLSEQRAQAVVNKLTVSGINSNRMKAKGYGKTMPWAPNKKSDGKDNPEGRQLNRRVELKITQIN